MTETRRPWILPMRARSIDETGRASTSLELFFDLCFVVAVAQAGSGLHHAVGEDHLSQALIGFPMVFFAIWWAWMNFTWFASAYDNDDVPYRLVVFVQIAGSLILAAGIPDAFEDGDFGLVTLGYLVMRMGLASMWLRAGLSDPDRRRTDLRYAAGVVIVQVGWILLLLAPDDWRIIGFAALVVAELSVPVWAERTGATSWHPHHVAERYGLFTIIVLGESVLSATIAVQSAFHGRSELPDLLVVAGSGLVIMCSMWWIYFSKPATRLLDHARAASVASVARETFIWGYGHYFVFASGAAVGAGLAIAVDQITDHASISDRGASLAVAVPVAIFVLSVWLLHRRAETTMASEIAAPLAAVVVLAGAAVGLSIAVTALVLVALVVTVVIRR